MPGAPALSMAYAGGATRPFGFTIGGQDVLYSPGTGAGADKPSITIKEAGPGDVSTLSATLLDPAGQIYLARGQRVYFEDLVSVGQPRLFAGWLQTWAAEHDGGVGRIYRVQCAGPESLLDWAVVPALSLPGGNAMSATDAIQAAASAAIGTGPLQWGAAGTHGTKLGPVTPGLSPLFAPVTVAGLSLRRTIDAIAAAMYAGQAFQGSVLNATVDSYFGLRVWESRQDQGGAFLSATIPDDWANLDISTAGPLYPAAPSDRIDATGAPVGVYVKGGNAAGSGYVGDGSGVSEGPVAILSDSSILTAQARDGAAATYLAERASTRRGTVGVEDANLSYPASAEIRAGVALGLVDPPIGLTSPGWRPFTIATITKRIVLGPTRQSWTIAYGGRAPSAVAMLRNLTRDATT